MSLKVKHRFEVDARDARDGDLLRANLANGSRLVLTIRRNFESIEAPCQLVLADPWLPPGLVRRTEDLALVMIRQESTYTYRQTTIDRWRVIDFAEKMRRDTVVIGSAYLHNIEVGTWLSGVIGLDPNLEYPPRITPMKWSAPSPVVAIVPA